MSKRSKTYVTKSLKSRPLNQDCDMTIILKIRAMKMIIMTMMLRMIILEVLTIIMRIEIRIVLTAMLIFFAMSVVIAAMY